jgi:hypothetical protein
MLGNGSNGCRHGGLAAASRDGYHRHRAYGEGDARALEVQCRSLSAVELVRQRLVPVTQMISLWGPSRLALAQTLDEVADHLSTLPSAPVRAR